jgi:hypothetical protein
VPIADTIPPLAHLRREQDFDGYIAQQLATEEMADHPTDGKSAIVNDIYAKKMIAKPYMYMDRGRVHPQTETGQEGDHGGHGVCNLHGDSYQR